SGSGLSSVAETESPQTIDSDRITARSSHHALKLAGFEVVGGDLAASEIAYQELLAKFPEVAGRLRDGPRSIEPIAMLEACHQRAVHREAIHVSESGSGNVISLGRVLHGVGDEDRAGHVLHVERREAHRDSSVVEGAGT